MDCSSFLRELRMHLHGLPEKKIDDIIEGYERNFAEAAANDISDEEVIERLGSPFIIAESLKKENQWGFEKKPEPERSEAGRLLVGISLIFFNLVLVLGPIVGIMGGLAGIYIALLACIVSPLLVLFTFLIASRDLLDLFVSCIASGVSIILLPHFMKLLRYCVSLLTRYIRWTAKQIRGIAR